MLNLVMWMRVRVARLRARFDPLYRAKWRRIRAAQMAANLPYERGEKWSPQVMSIEETLRDIIGNRRSVARFGDGEFALVCGRKMLFENANGELGRRLAEILANPDPRCLVAICDVFGRLDGILPRDWTFWREVMQWAREGVCRALHADYRATPPRLALGNAYISGPYMQVSDRTNAPRAFGLWKELVADKVRLSVPSAAAPATTSSRARSRSAASGVPPAGRSPATARFSRPSVRRRVPATSSSSRSARRRRCSPTTSRSPASGRSTRGMSTSSTCG